MIKLAVKAQLPIVAVTSRDTMNLPDVIETITGKVPEIYKSSVEIQNEKLYMFMLNRKSIELPLTALYEKLVNAESTLILVNPAQVVEPMFDAGEVEVPKSMIRNMLLEVVEDEDDPEARATELLRGLGGCTITESAELCRLTMARDGSLTLNGLMTTRKSSFQASSGLTQVDTNQSFYLPNPKLAAWVEKERSYFLTGADFRLIPRGLLFDGPPGVGKTAGAKWIAQELGVPLYRVDIGGTKNKYVGQSEANLLTNLNRLDHEEPCVALLDEVEKIFATSNHDSSGTTSTMLSQLLWWLAERRSRVLVVMTTNKASSLPKELYREGRIDEVMWFGGLEKGSAGKFVMEVLDTFPAMANLKPEHVDQIVNEAFKTSKFDTNPPTVSQASLTTATYAFVKTLQSTSK